MTPPRLKMFTPAKTEGGVPGRTHKSYFPVAQISSYASVVLLQLDLGNLAHDSSSWTRGSFVI
jgi:hypothetical protein